MIERIPGWKPPRSTAIFPGPHSVIDAVKGIVPAEWTDTLCAFGLSLVQARAVASKVGLYIVAAAQRAIWQPHPDVQILHEHSLLVNQKAKTCHRAQATLLSHHTIINPHHTHISCALAGWCHMCQLSLTGHPVGICPPLLSQAPYLVDSMLQMYHRSLCSLSSIVNPHVALRVLDSTGGVATGP